MLIMFHWACPQMVDIWDFSKTESIVMPFGVPGSARFRQLRLLAQSKSLNDCLVADTGLLVASFLSMVFLHSLCLPLNLGVTLTFIVNKNMTFIVQIHTKKSDK